MKTGRPSKLPPFGSAERLKLTQDVESYAALGLRLDDIALVLNIARSTFCLWAKKADISDALKSGRVKSDSKVIKSLYERALGGDTTACIFWLKNRQPDRWRDKHDHAVEGELRTDNKLIIEIVKTK
jgi:hypothetical protein